MNEVENAVNFVGGEQTGVTSNACAKYVGNETIISYPQRINAPHCSDDTLKNIKPFTSGESESRNYEIKLNAECVPTTSVGITGAVSVSEQTSSNNVPGIEFLLHNNMPNTSLVNYGLVQSFPPLSNSIQNEKLNESVVHNYQQLFNSEQREESTKNYQQIDRSSKQIDGIIESLNNYQQMGKPAQNNQPNESVQSCQQLALTDKINGSVENIQHINNSAHPDKLNETAEGFQHMSHPLSTEKLNTSVQNIQPINNPAQSDNLNESTKSYRHRNIVQADKLHESVQNLKYLNNALQAEKLHISVQSYQHMNNPVQTNKLNEIVQDIEHGNDSVQIKKLTETDQRCQQHNESQKLNESHYEMSTDSVLANEPIDSVQNIQMLSSSLKNDKSNESLENKPSGNLGPGVQDKSVQNYQLVGNSRQTENSNESIQNYQQFGNSKETEKHAESVQNAQPLGSSAETDQTDLDTDSYANRENKAFASIAQLNPGNVVNPLNGTITPVSRERSVPRKPVGIREPIAIREQISSTNNVPGIEYLLHNDLRNPSMINPVYLRNSEQFRNKQSGNGTFNQGMEAMNRREYKNESMTTSMVNNVVVIDSGPIVTRELLVPRKPVGIREPIAMREPISNPNAVPGIEYLLHNEVHDHLNKKTRPSKEERPFLCTTCGNKFRQQSHLQQHIRIHTNHRPYQCSFCEKAFKQKSQLNQHERIHTGEKPYKCSICDKAFAQAGQLYSHRKTHGLNINKITSQRDGRDHLPKKRGRRAKLDEISSTEVGSPPSVIYIMEPHPRPQRPSVHFQFPRPINDFHPNLFNNGSHYPTDKLPKIETVVSLGPRSRLPTPSSPASTSSSTTSCPQLYHWKHDTSKESPAGT